MKTTIKEQSQPGVHAAADPLPGPLLDDSKWEVHLLIERFCEKIVPVNIWEPPPEEECRRRNERQKQDRPKNSGKTFRTANGTIKQPAVRT